jgi:four helix bundle protein
MYAQTATFPKAELFGLTSQMRRAAVSVAANIAEGCYLGPRAQANSVRIALGSAGELDYYIILATDLELLSTSERETLANEISQVKAVVTGFLRSINASIENEAHNGKRQNGKR